MTLDDVREWARKKTNGGVELPDGATADDGHWYGAVSLADGGFGQYDATSAEAEFAALGSDSRPFAYKVTLRPGEWGLYVHPGRNVCEYVLHDDRVEVVFKFAGDMPGAA